MLRNAAIAADQVLYCNGRPYSTGVPRGLGLAHVPIVDQGETWEQRPRDKAAAAEVYFGSGPAQRPPVIEVWINQQLHRVGWRILETCPAGTRFAYEEPGVLEIYAQSFGRATFRISLRTLVQYGKPISDLRVFVYGTEIDVAVEFQAERQLCQVTTLSKLGQLITLADGKTPGSDSPEELGWLLGGVLDTRLPAGVADRFGAEVTAEDQYAQQGTCWRSLDFVVQPALGRERFGPPLILERDAWRPLFSGQVEDRRDLEAKLATFYRGLVYQRRGWATFGDWAHIPGDPYRTRYNDHYFTVTALHRAVVRSQSPGLWDDLARAAGSYVRDMCWRAGSKSHGKGVAPWSGPWSTNMHHVCSESLLMQFLCYGDLFAKREYDAWLAAFTLPTAPGRDSRTAKRMCDVARAYTGEARWREWSDRIQDVELAREANNEPVTGRLWHPEWCDKTILKDQMRPEGIINGRAFPRISAWRPRQISEKTLTAVPDNAGPMGEGHLLLQLHALADAERVYAANHGDPRIRERPSTTITIDKRDDRPLDLHLRIGPRIGGDRHQTSVRVYDPSGTCVLEVPAIDLKRTEQDAAGYSVVTYNTSLAGPRGLWRLDVASYALALYAPVSDWREWQAPGDYKFPAY